MGFCSKLKIETIFSAKILKYSIFRIQNLSKNLSIEKEESKWNEVMYKMVKINTKMRLF